MEADSGTGVGVGSDPTDQIEQVQVTLAAFAERMTTGYAELLPLLGTLKPSINELGLQLRDLAEVCPAIHQDSRIICATAAACQKDIENCITTIGILSLSINGIASALMQQHHLLAGGFSRDSHELLTRLDAAVAFLSDTQQLAERKSWDPVALRRQAGSFGPWLSHAFIWGYFHLDGLAELDGACFTEDLPREAVYELLQDWNRRLNELEGYGQQPWGAPEAVWAELAAYAPRLHQVEQALRSRISIPEGDDGVQLKLLADACRWVVRGLDQWAADRLPGEVVDLGVV